MNQKTVSYRTYSLALSKLQAELDLDRTITVYDMGSNFGNEPIRLGVNWSAIGTVPASEAVDFAQRLMDAAKAAEGFEYNGYVVTYGEG
ncbi:hypothetical protein C814_01214 [Anaerotruncus sp. G3(2012)]|jgi:hypothetical protein|uniref:hypothetical protein n=1 Tax=Anaerotruncus sp. G3(2012) TaxID=1235835 RepID=UPI000334E1DB|nr:hypothetical protein [Anaerotruncus sp. G3(2012)]EOS62365.1 hypothetical protein C814_01214 [Anaerotruncus sp. G3(2012)]